MVMDFTEYLDPIETQPSVIEKLTEQILRLIIDGELKPGDRLPSEQEIIQATRASRPSVREALRSLKTLGIIETRPGSGSFVRSVEIAGLLRPELVTLVLMGEDFDQIMETRKILECEVARRAARAGSEEHAKIRASLDDMRLKAGSGEKLHEATWAFHMAIAAAATNAVMAKLVSILYEMTDRILPDLYWPYIDHQEEVQHHADLYQRIRQGEKEAALAMSDHIDFVAGVVRRDIRHRTETSSDNRDIDPG